MAFSNPPIELANAAAFLMSLTAKWPSAYCSGFAFAVRLGLAAIESD